MRQKKSLSEGKNSCTFAVRPEKIERSSLIEVVEKKEKMSKEFFADKLNSCTFAIRSKK